jgi:hypothetical protein
MKTQPACSLGVQLPEPGIVVAQNPQCPSTASHSVATKSTCRAAANLSRIKWQAVASVRSLLSVRCVLINTSVFC